MYDVLSSNMLMQRNATWVKTVLSSSISHVHLCHQALVMFISISHLSIFIPTSENNRHTYS